MNNDLEIKNQKLREILRSMKNVLVAFSGGVDSTFLLKVAQQELGDKVLAVIAGSETYPEQERESAISLAQDMRVKYELIQSKEMDNPDFISNSPQRCYYCKMELFSRLKEIAERENIPHVLDGSNFEDTGDFRPGSRAAQELGVRSPLQEAGFMKQEIRELSRKLGLPTWEKPAMACLSSRFPYGTKIDSASLEQIAQAEDTLRTLGFSQLRVRHHGDTARIEVPENEIVELVEPEVRKKVIAAFQSIGYTYITLDLKGYRTGSMNEILSADPSNE